VIVSLRPVRPWLGPGSGLGEAEGVGAGLDDVPAEGETVDDGRAEPGAVNVSRQQLRVAGTALALPLTSSALRVIGYWSPRR
jgi:hypothetical protein